MSPFKQTEHFDGYYKAQQRVYDMVEISELLAVLDELYGRGYFDDFSDFNDVRAEALRQLEIEWRTWEVEAT